MATIATSLSINAIQVKLARVALGLGVRQLAAMVGMSSNTIARLERGEELKPSTLSKIRQALEAAGVEIIDDEDGRGAGVRLSAPVDVAAAGAGSHSGPVQVSPRKVGRNTMANAYIESRPKGPESTPITGYVVESSADAVLHSTKTQAEAIEWAKKAGYSPHVARVRRLDNDKRKPDHWRAV